ncbi:MAG: hypothetical protein WD534_13305, partial [Phycisphaeraceae bacterium]
MTEVNQHPEQHARDRIDRLLTGAGWQIQSKDAMNVFAALGVAVRELQTTEPVLFTHVPARAERGCGAG